jgi:5-formyltetrahydrofolate cyclo-ligase
MQVMGQTADLYELQKLLQRSKNKLSDSQQQNLTRWAVLQAINLLKRYKKEYVALMAAMQRGAPVAECIQAIEEAV